VTAVAKVEIIITREGNGPENERRKVASFTSSEKLAALVDDQGVVGALLRDEFERDEITQKIGVRRR
jgi:hypothetical protein